MAAFATPDDVTLANGGTAAGSTDFVQRELDVASARLRRLLPDLQARVEADEDVDLLAREVVAQAVLRRTRNNGQGVAEVSAVTRSAGPFSETTNFRGPRNDYFTLEELALLRAPRAGLGFGSINIFTPNEIRAIDAR